MAIAQPRESYQVQAVDRALALLKALGNHGEPATLAELSAATNLSKPTAFRLLSSLMAAGFAEQDSLTGDYRIGTALQTLAADAGLFARGNLDGLAARATCLRHMRDARDELNESVCLFVRVGDKRVLVAQEEGRQTIRSYREVGETADLYLTASSRLLLAGMDDREISAYLERVRPTATDGTPIPPGELWAQIRRAREAGIAESFNERNLGGAAVAAPIRDASGRVVAALHISVPVTRYDEALRTRCLELAPAVATRISEDLGYTPDPDKAQSGDVTT